jgi:hypothetical protein
MGSVILAGVIDRFPRPRRPQAIAMSALEDGDKPQE